MKKVLKNTSALLVSHAIGRFFSLILTLIILPRHYTENEIGAYFIALFAVNMIASISELGLQNPLIREMTLRLDHARHFLGNGMIIRFLLSIVAFATMNSIAIWLNYPIEIVEMIRLLGIAALINGMAQLYRCTFRAFEKMEFEAITVIAERLVTLIVGGGLILIAKIDLHDFCVVVLISSVLNLILSVVLVRSKFVRLSFRIDPKICSVLLKQALPFAIGNVFGMIYLRLDMILLSKLSGMGEVMNAWYGYAFTIVNAFTIIPGAFMGAMFPVMARELERKTIHFRISYTDSIRWMLTIAIPITLVLSLLSEQIALLIFPNFAWEKISSTLTLLSWSGGLSFLTTVLITVLRAGDRRIPFTILIGATMLINLALNFLLIPRFDQIGSAIAMIVSEGFLLIAGIGYIWRRISDLRDLRFLRSRFLIAIVMALILIILRQRISVLILAPMTIGIYFAITFFQITDLI